MIIKLNKEYRINTDDKTCPLIIEKRRVKGEKAKVPGAESWEAYKYPCNMLGLEYTLQQLGLADSEDLEELRRIMEDFAEALRELRK